MKGFGLLDFRSSGLVPNTPRKPARLAPPSSAPDAVGRDTGRGSRTAVVGSPEGRNPRPRVTVGSSFWKANMSHLVSSLGRLLCCGLQQSQQFKYLTAVWFWRSKTPGGIDSPKVAGNNPFFVDNVLCLALCNGRPLFGEALAG